MSHPCPAPGGAGGDVPVPSRSLTGAAAPAVGDDAAEVPEAGLAAVALEAAHAGFAGALPRARVAGAAVGAVGVALAGAWGQTRVVGEGGLLEILGGRRHWQVLPARATRHNQTRQVLAPPWVGAGVNAGVAVGPPPWRRQPLLSTLLAQSYSSILVPGTVPIPLVAACSLPVAGSGFKL